MSQTADPINPLAPVTSTLTSVGVTSTVEKVPVSWLKRAIPSRFASSTTAAATFGATSRLKTLGMM